MFKYFILCYIWCTWQIIRMLDFDWGSVPDWISAGLSALAIYFVYWQVNRQMKNEKILKVEYSRPMFSFNLINHHHEDIKTYIPDNGDIQDLRSLNRNIGHGTSKGNILQYDPDYSKVTPFMVLNRLFYINNPSTHPMLFVKIVVTFKNGKDYLDKNESFWIGRISENESVQILPDRYIENIKNKKWTFDDDPRNIIEGVKLFFTTESNEKFMYLYSYKNSDLSLKEHRKVIEDGKNGEYSLYLFDQNPYIIFQAK